MVLSQMIILNIQNIAKITTTTTTTVTVIIILQMYHNRKIQYLLTSHPNTTLVITITIIIQIEYF